MKMVMDNKNVPTVKVHNKNVNYKVSNVSKTQNAFQTMSMLDMKNLRKMRPGQFDGSCKACGH